MSPRLETSEIIKLRSERKEAQEKLRTQQKTEGLTLKQKPAMPNRKSGYKSIEEEEDIRNFATIEQSRIFQSQQPVLLKRLAKIKDPRNPKKIKYKLTLLMIYGMLMFVYQMNSRRESNRVMTRAQFMASLKELFPELEDIPHNDTLMRLLARIEIYKIESALIAAIKKLIENKKFTRYLEDNCYRIAIDGTQKFVRDILWSEECSEREVKSGDGNTKMQYFVYVLEANLVFSNGMSIPLMSEFSNYKEGDKESKKQDCEQKAFKRLANRLKANFPRLSIMVLLDGLYPNGPIVELCRKNRWDFMIVLQKKNLPSVWEEYEGLKKIETENHFDMTWGNRYQHFEWVNYIEYYYGPNEKQKQILHLVICQETWEEVAKDSTEIVTKKSYHAWISNKPFYRTNVHKRCNLGARHRWGIESGILVEKRHGYQYEHSFSYNWNAMRGYHYLMRIGHFINILVMYSECLVETVREFGVRGFIKFIRGTISGRWLDPLRVKRGMEAHFQLRLI